MRWKKDLSGSKIRDVRGRSRGLGLRGGGGRGLLSIAPLLLRFLGVKGTIVVAVIAGGIFLLKPNLITSLLNGSPQQTSQISNQSRSETDQAAAFIDYVKGSNDVVWKHLLNEVYRDPSLEIMTDRKGTGPYYMPSRETISIDPTFFSDLANRHDSPGDFAQAYVLAHETAHHVQKLFGLTTFVHSNHGRAGYNELSVRLELYADFLAGVWAHHAVRLEHFEMEEGDLEEGITAATNIGDDVLQRKAGAWKIDPSKFTHGTGEQRRAWLLYGFKTGNYRACHLFNVEGKTIQVGHQGLMPPTF